MILAHGTGEASAFPVDITYALIGGSWALAISFLVLAFAWRKPKLSPDKHVAVLPGLTRFADARVLRELLGALGVALTVAAMVVGCLHAGDDDNPLVGTFFIWLWVGLVPLSLLFGPVGRVLSPVRTVHRWVCAALHRSPSDGFLPYHERWGRWPAAVGLFAFVWLELGYAHAHFTAVFVWCLVYLAVTAVGGALFGSSWFSNAEPFEVYSSVIASLSPLGRDEKSRELVLRSPLDGLTTYRTGPGAVAVIAVLMGSTAFDAWSAVYGLHSAWARTALLLTFIVAVGVTFALATMATGGVSREKRLAIPGRMAHSLIPIAVGYLIAHYAKYLVEDGQETGHAWIHAFGGGEPHLWAPFTDHPTLLSVLAVASIVLGHLLAVVSAHDAALRILPRKHELTGQLALMLMMCGYTFAGLYLLFGG
ncbi:MAG: hypothetical protein QM774_05065 [Gordonia sp. (in: high G+C Gram-positive bacteria)]|uniref:hypothetical protein n=1 Tax=Gordonia sp. (in: high G+C Gram-positive bacteria) TaxID=84139 RepID=UPI0039E24BF4